MRMYALTDMPVLLVEGEAVRVQSTGRRQEPDGRLDGAAAARDPLEHPLEHAAVVAEARPQELAVGVLAEPVDEEDLRQLGALALADAQPVRPVVGHVVATEREHGERITPHDAD